MFDKRYIKFDGASNFREIGALETTSGRLKRGILYRSDELSKLSDGDLIIFENLGIKSICDLRTPNERKSKPDRLPGNNAIKIINTPFFHQKRDYNQLQIMWFLITNSKKVDFEKFIKEHYINNTFERAKEVGSVIKLILDKENLPLLIHCKAGKDRTGLIAAIIQLLAGVEKEKIYEEYLSTNNYMKQQMEITEQAIRKMSFYRITPEKIKPLLEVRREYLEDILNKIFTKYGTLEDYLIKACEVDSEEIKKIKSIICE